MDKTSLGFQKPKEEEYYDINIFNQNAQLANDLIEKNSSAIGQSMTLVATPPDLNEFININKWCAIALASDVANVPSNDSSYNNAAVYNFGQNSGTFQQVYFSSQTRRTLVRDYVSWWTPKWSPWREIATSEIYTLIPLVGVSTAYDETPTLIRTGKICAIHGTVNLNSITATSAIFQKIPPQFLPKRGAEIFMKNLFPPTLLSETRLYVNVDGIISIHGFQGTITSTSASFNGIWEV